MPESFSRLQLWGIWGEANRFYTAWMSLLCRDVEPTTIFNDKNMMVWPRVHTFSKGRHHCLVCVFVQSGNVTAQQEDLRSGNR